MAITKTKTIKRGYFGIGVYHPKTSMNIGTLWRSAYIFGASFIFTIGKRFPKQCSDTVKAFRHIPLFEYQTYEDFKEKIPYSCQVVCVELDDKAQNLKETTHPQQAIYLLGAEDYGIPKDVLKGKMTIQIPSARDFCLNVAVAGSIVMYDRLTKI